MIPPAQRRIYENFRDQLIQLLQQVREIAQRSQASETFYPLDRENFAAPIDLESSDRSDAPSPANSSPTNSSPFGVISSGLANLQGMFREQVLILPLDEIDYTHQTKVQSYQAEISKQLRLVGLDCTFLAAARQPQTQARRVQQVLDRVETLIRYCNGILGELEENPGNSLQQS
ncbi:heterocyst frequency control protein PatD [Alkalinema pantanalense CENA528]|uniref:heterocyst frequency control protein PatD n=1 Tax=Alkalinema pantanalense TaxID=1620705 RepID=UPI003D6FBCA1